MKAQVISLEDARRKRAERELFEQSGAYALTCEYLEYVEQEKKKKKGKPTK